MKKINEKFLGKNGTDAINRVSTCMTVIEFVLLHLISPENFFTNFYISSLLRSRSQRSGFKIM